MKKTKKESLYSTLITQIKSDKKTATVFFIMQGLIILVGIRSVMLGNYEHTMLCVLSLVLFMMPAFVERKFGIDIPPLLETSVYLFIFAAEILGEISSFYIKFPHWDDMLHTANGFLCAALGFSLIEIFNRSKKLKFELSPFFLAVVAFCFSMTIGVLWEFFEWAGDALVQTDMQKDSVVNFIASTKLDLTKSNISVQLKDIADTIIVMKDGTTLNLSDYGINGYMDLGLHDTMHDLLVNFIGAATFSIIGCIYVKTRGKKSKFAKSLIPTVTEAD
ncbi:MAG: hypothetical protein IJF58_01440 [Clostridia bacterium]|nr:hypothetical protein [Clostridia bacterium]